MHKKSFSKAAASLFALTLLVAPSVYADQSAIGFDNLTAAKATADFCAGKVTSEALVTAALSRAKALAELNAFITLDDNGALAAAKQADAARKSGARCRPLEGVPIVVKDNIEDKGTVEVCSEERCPDCGQASRSRRHHNRQDKHA